MAEVCFFPAVVGVRVPELWVVQALGCPRFERMQLILLWRSSGNSNPRVVSENFSLLVVCVFCVFLTFGVDGSGDNFAILQCIRNTHN